MKEAIVLIKQIKLCYLDGRVCYLFAPLKSNTKGGSIAEGRMANLYGSWRFMRTVKFAKKWSNAKKKRKSLNCEY